MLWHNLLWLYETIPPLPRRHGHSANVRHRRCLWASRAIKSSCSKTTCVFPSRYGFLACSRSHRVKSGTVAFPRREDGRCSGTAIQSFRVGWPALPHWLARRSLPRCRDRQLPGPPQRKSAGSGARTPCVRDAGPRQCGRDACTFKPPFGGRVLLQSRGDVAACWIDPGQPHDCLVRQIQCRRAQAHLP